MFGMLFESQFFLLQGTRYFKEDNPMEGMILLIIVVVAVLAAVIYRVVGGGGSGKSSKGKSGGVSPRKFNAFTLLRLSSAYGLDREQTKLLEYIFRNDGVSDPERSIKNPVLLDRHFKKAYRAIEKHSTSEEDAQQRMLKLFALRSIIESTPPPGKDGVSSNRLADNTPAILGIGASNYPIKIITSRGQTIVTEMPKNTLGTPIRLSKGGAASLSFFNKSSNGFSLDCQITGSANTPQGLGLQLTHTGKTKSLVKRKYRRRDIEVRCEFCYVNVAESGTGKNKVSKLVVDNRKFSGTIHDVSIGGCSFKTITSIQADSRIKINIDSSTNNIAVLGQVLRINRSGPGGVIVHVKFLKVPRRAFNSISAMVYGYSDN